MVKEYLAHAMLSPSVGIGTPVNFSTWQEGLRAWPCLTLRAQILQKKLPPGETACKRSSTTVDCAGRASLMSTCEFCGGRTAAYEREGLQLTIFPDVPYLGAENDFRKASSGAVLFYLCAQLPVT